MIRAVLFDLDGTLWENPVRWDELRRELGLPPDGLPIYWHISRLPEGKRRKPRRACGKRKLKESDLAA
jgi:FMN phosphatase YigB (HAD superfamily)